ncbi:outer membrane beta-barrel protein [Candidatus Methylacidiphilum infernorum]|uniref:Outer membrane beta-barrel protein n=2 Tax=Candidatus Methylacidiphilum infernorum TaxID=511746 RepID=A0ABX7PY09_9BACT|nr:outer membrane beta-barrel protein [Candidatus Methylacidiphilum infernorum]
MFFFPLTGKRKVLLRAFLSFPIGPLGNRFFYFCFSLSKKIILWVCIMGVALKATRAVDLQQESIAELQKALEEGGIAVESRPPAIALSGYIDSSYTYNFISAHSGKTAAQTAQIPTRMDSDGIAGGGWNLNQVYLVIEKPLSEINDWQSGFRADLMLGEDAASMGMPDNIVGLSTPNNNGLALNISSFLLAQAYAQFRVPVGNGLDLKMGKFMSPFAFEVMERPANVNFSYGLIFSNLIPEILVGAEAVYPISNLLELTLGITDGGFNTARGGFPFFGEVNNEPFSSLFLGSLRYETPRKNALVTTSILFGPDGADPPGFGLYPGFAGEGVFRESPYNRSAPFVLGDIYGSWIPQVSKDRLLVALELTGGFYNGGVALPTDPLSSRASANWYGASFWMKYQLTALLSIAFRQDWIEGSNNEILYEHVGRTDIWSSTLTFRIDLWENMMLRAEGRMDWGKDVVGAILAPLGLPSVPVSSGPAFFAAIEAAYAFW